MTGIRRYMLDTNVILGIILSDKTFAKSVRNIIDFDYGTIFVSVEVLKELSYLKQSGRTDIKMNFSQFVDFFESRGFEIAPFDQYAARRYDELPLLENHKDPFDRAIIAHAIASHATLISADSKFRKYRKNGLELIEI